MWRGVAVQWQSQEDAVGPVTGRTQPLMRSECYEIPSNKKKCPREHDVCRFQVSLTNNYILCYCININFYSQKWWFQPFSLLPLYGGFSRQFHQHEILYHRYIYTTVHLFMNYVYLYLTHKKIAFLPPNNKILPPWEWNCPQWEYIY